MRLLFFCDDEKGAGKAIQKMIEAQVRKEDMEIYRTIGDLSRRLHQPRGTISIVVLLAANRENLGELLLLADLLNDIPMILVLPDRKADTISKGHKFHPRFTCYMDNGFSDAALVLEKMIKIQQKQRRNLKCGRI